MGHYTFFEEFLKDTPPAKIQARMDYVGDCNKDPFEGGVGTGVNPITFYEDKIYDDLIAAEEAIKLKDKGWYDSLAVLYYDTNNLPSTKQIEDLERRIKNEKDSVDKLYASNAINKRKSKTTTCTKCESRINNSYISDKIHNFNKCPVCGNDLSSSTYIETLNHKKQKITELQKELNNRRRKNVTKGKVKWLVKSEVHC